MSSDFLDINCILILPEFLFPHRLYFDFARILFPPILIILVLVTFHTILSRLAHKQLLFIPLASFVCARCRTNSTTICSTYSNTGKFTINVGMHQGSALCPFHFLLVLDHLTGGITK